MIKQKTNEMPKVSDQIWMVKSSSGTRTSIYRISISMKSHHQSTIINALSEYIITPEDQYLSDNEWTISPDNDHEGITGWNAGITIRMSTCR
jgi:hypothetical protein